MTPSRIVLAGALLVLLAPLALGSTPFEDEGECLSWVMVAPLDCDLRAEHAGTFTRAPCVVGDDTIPRCPVTVSLSASGSGTWLDAAERTLASRVFQTAFAGGVSGPDPGKAAAAMLCSRTTTDAVATCAGTVTVLVELPQASDAVPAHTLPCRDLYVDTTFAPVDAPAPGTAHIGWASTKLRVCLD